MASAFQQPPGWDRESSPYHSGEQSVQARAGARDMAERVGRKVIRSFMPDQHCEFFAALPFLILGSLDEAGRPWASIVTGPPGFAQSPDPRRLAIEAKPLPADPLGANLRAGAAVAVLGIQPETRRRNRMNGKVIAAGSGGFTVAVDQSFGNCPKYIQARAARFIAGASASDAAAAIRWRARM
jgi:predicted pyridoxine 5'-phosphate oxidase superfamily flavin-nucleotide-binding protein